jgi:uncharacterized protein YhaN
MIIKRLSASFGRLSGDTLDLKNGLNIIEAPNECGKSTWCAFIRAMLYGLRADRDKQGYLSDKTRYRPWSGAAMEGAMELETGGRLVTIERTAGGKLPMKDFRAIYTGTGLPFDGLSPDTAGETLFGVSAEVFERSAFISQAGIKIGQTPELEKRISALVSTGDESSSYTEADERLRLWLRKRRFNKSGTIPALEDILALLSKRLAAIAAAQEITADMRLETERLKKRHDDLEGELRAYDRYEARLACSRAQDKLLKAKAGFDAVGRELTRNGPAPSVSDIAAIRGDLKALVPLQKMRSDEQSRLDDARERHTRLFDDKNALPFKETGSASAYEQALILSSKVKNLSFGSPLSVIPSILFLAAGALAAILPAARLPAAAAALVFAVVVVLRAILLGSAKEKLGQHLSGLGVCSVEALKRLCDDDAQLTEALAQAHSEVKSSEKSAVAAAEAHDAVLQSLLDRLKTFSLSADLDAIENELLRVEVLVGKLAAARSEIMAAESFLQAVEDSGADVPGCGADDDNGPPTRGRQEIASELHRVTSRLEELTGRYNMALGEIRAMGDPAILGSEKKTTETELGAQKTQYDALTLAVDTLRGASTELQARFSPFLSETAGNIIRRLTGGRYDRLAFDKALDAMAKTADETVSRNILALSTGTADQIYLALRLAIVELVLPAENPCPLILDDVFSNFDDRRAALALDYLLELSAERQILLFTCHGREGAYFLGKSDVNVISFKR